jgi:hypothetical protein
VQNRIKILLNLTKIQKLYNKRIQKLMLYNKRILKKLGAGMTIGAINGLFGGGGGMVAVPILKNALLYDEKRAHATAIYIIAPVCLFSSITYIIGGYVKLWVVIPSAIGFTLGGILGAQFLKVFPQRITKLIFAIVMLVAGVRMVLP